MVVKPFNPKIQIRAMVIRRHATSAKMALQYIQNDAGGGRLDKVTTRERLKKVRQYLDSIEEVLQEDD